MHLQRALPSACPAFLRTERAMRRKQRLTLPSGGTEDWSKPVEKCPPASQKLLHRFLHARPENSGFRIVTETYEPNSAPRGQKSPRPSLRKQSKVTNFPPPALWISSSTTCSGSHIQESTYDLPVNLRTLWKPCGLLGAELQTASL